jgi:hypothetical protein
MTKLHKQSSLQRINRILEFYHKRGVNKERVNSVHRKIIKNKLKKFNLVY